MPLKITFQFSKQEKKTPQAFAFGEKNVGVRKPGLRICVHQQSDLKTHHFVAELHFLF